MLSLFKRLTLITLKIINKCTNYFSLFIILSITCHLTLIFLLNLQHSIYIKKNDNFIKNIPYMHTSMIDFNLNSTIIENNNKKNYKTPTFKKDRKHSTKNHIQNQSIISKDTNINNKNIKKSSLNNTTKKNSKLQENIKVNDLINKLAENQHINKNLNISKNIENNLLNNNNKIKNLYSDEIEDFKNKIHQAISDKFYNYSSYTGKNCDINIKIGIDGKVISLVSVKGDSGLCQAAISATKLAKLPKPPDNYIYDVFKNTTLKFSPK